MDNGLGVHNGFPFPIIPISSSMSVSSVTSLSFICVAYIPYVALISYIDISSSCITTSPLMVIPISIIRGEKELEG